MALRFGRRFPDTRWRRVPLTKGTYTPFLRRFTDERALDLAEAKALHQRVRALHKASPWSSEHAAAHATLLIVDELRQHLALPPDGPLKLALDRCLFQVVSAETTIFTCPDIDWSRSHLSLKEQVDLCRFLRAQEHFLENTDRVFDIFVHMCGNLYGGVVIDLPKETSDGPPFEVPLLSILKDPNRLVGHFLAVLSNEKALEAGLFADINRRLYENVCAVSHVVPDEEQKRAFVMPEDSKLPPEEMAEAYLHGTPLLDLLKTPVPFAIPEETRFEHHWIVAGSGHGKTQTLQYLIAHDLLPALRGKASIVVIDSQGDLIRNISRLQCFANHPEKLVMIDPTDIEYPVALNLFDVGMDRIAGYSQLDRERTLNGILELYDFVIGSLLSAELTQKQGVIFRYITRLMLHIPNATIQTLRELMEPGGFEKYRPYIAQLQGTARAFFETEFQSKQFEDTKRQVVRRLWGILENTTFERMFSHPKSKLNLFDEMNAGKVILINTAKDLLKQQGTEIFGRFFIAMIAQAAQERATLTRRMPTHIYIDECQDYLDANVALILEQARKFKVGMVLAHQYIGQLAPKLQESFAANTSIKFAGGVSDRDARAMAGMLRCSSDFIEEQPKGHFAAYIRNVTEHAVSLEVPFGTVETLPRMTETAWCRVRDEMRRRYAVHHSEVELHIAAQIAPPPLLPPPKAPKTKPALDASPPVEAIRAHTAPSHAPTPGEPVTGGPPPRPIDPDTVDVSPSTDW